MFSKIINQIDKMFFIYLGKNTTKFSKRVVKFLANYYPDARIRKQYWSELGVFMDDGTYPNIGFIATSNRNNIFIGKNVSIAPYVTIISESNANNGELINEISYVKDNLTKIKSVIIEDEVWIGANVTILPGVTIGRCSVIGAGSVVVSDVTPFSIYAGIPAKKIKDLKLSEESNNGI